MNTMKREDMIKERNELTQLLFNQMMQFFAPLTNILTGATRLMHLDSELRKITPGPKPTIVPTEEPAIGKTGNE